MQQHPGLSRRLDPPPAKMGSASQPIDLSSSSDEEKEIRFTMVSPQGLARKVTVRGSSERTQKHLSCAWLPAALSKGQSHSPSRARTTT